MTTRESRVSPGIIILAAGLGKRMHSPTPKVLHPLSGQPLLFHILDRISEVCSAAPIAIVVGHGRELVQTAIQSNARFKNLKITYVHQAEQLGTGHAARCAMDSAWGKGISTKNLDVLVLPGDLPLLPASLIAEMIHTLSSSEVMRLLVCKLSDPTGYGRIIRKGKNGPVLKIIEEKDASPREKTITEVATSIYFFKSGFLSTGLHKLSNKNAQKEFYLTDLVAQAAKKKSKVLEWPEASDLRGVNDPWELAQAERLMNERTAKVWAKKGVRFIDPWSTRLDVHSELSEGVVVHPGAILMGNCQVGANTVLGPNVVLKDTIIGAESNIKTGTVSEDSVIGDRVQLGPYAHLRPESTVGDYAKIGNFVELKKSKIGEHTSVAHLSYLGDAEVGKNVNIGCGFITCNFDGRVIDGNRKHKTIIEDNVFMGSDCQVVAPVRIGKGSYIASGSTITEDVQPDSLAIARSRQVTKKGYASRLKTALKSSGEKS